MTSRLAISLLLVWSAGCAEEVPGPPPSVNRTAPQVTSFSSPEWSRPNPKNAIAEVNGATVTSGMLRAQMKAYPNVQARPLLRALLEMEVLAQRAQQAGAGQSPSAVQARREALVRAYLDDVFEVEIVPEAYPMENVRKDYILNRSRYWFDSDAWLAAHLHETCCVPSQKNCDTKEARQCFLDSEARLYGTYEVLTKRLKGKKLKPRQVATVLADYRTEIGDLNPNLRYEKFSFYYDPKKAHKDHVGRHTVYDESVVRSVIAGKTGVIQEPVRSQFGWHIMVKIDHKPAQKKTVDDPEVIADLRKRVFPRFRKAMFRQRVSMLFKRFEVRLEPKGLAVLDAL